jgi:hypothetical protein
MELLQLKYRNGYSSKELDDIIGVAMRHRRRAHHRDSRKASITYNWRRIQRKSEQFISTYVRLLSLHVSTGDTLVLCTLVYFSESIQTCVAHR